jgi:alanine dehydrogenase
VWTSQLEKEIAKICCPKFNGLYSISGGVGGVCVGVVVVLGVVVVVVVSARLACLYFISCISHDDHSQLQSTETHFSSHMTKFTINSSKGKNIAKTVQKVYGAVAG